MEYMDATVMPEKLIRKVQLMGGSTYIVSLPKEWARKHGIKRGSIVEVRPQPDGSLRILPGYKKPPENAVTLKAEAPHTVNSIVREITARYLAGYKLITVKYPPEKGYVFAEKIRDLASRKLMGAEILSEADGETVIHILVNIRELPLNEVVRRMSRVSKSMLLDCVEYFESAALTPPRVDEIISRDDLVDKLFLYGMRQLFLLLKGYLQPDEIGVKGLYETLSYASVLKSIERVADHAAAVAHTCRDVKVDRASCKKLRCLADMAGLVARFFEESVDVFLRRERREAHRLLDTMPDLIAAREEKVVKSIHGLPVEAAIKMRTVLFSYRRVSDYSCDVLEATLGLDV